MPRYLWLARSHPFPLNAGDRIYSARLVEAVARSGVAVTFVGHAGAAPAQTLPGVEWRIVPGGTSGTLASLVSLNPLEAARHKTRAYRGEIACQAASGSWDAVVVDHYGTGWVLRQRGLFGEHTPFVYIAHNHEESVTRQQWIGSQTDPLLARLHFAQNHIKTRWSERRCACACDVIATNTNEDAAVFGITAPGVPTIVLSPGFAGPYLAKRQISADTPRAVVMLGSYRWSAKKASLRLFLDHADPVLGAAGIEIRVIGDIAEDVRRWMEARYPAARFVGFVEDPSEHLNARLAVIAEPIGGGFKHKLLNYIFNRVPVAALDVCASGLPDAVRGNMILCHDLKELIQRVVAAIDDPPMLDLLQNQAFTTARGAFDWLDRGRYLRDTITQLQRGRPGHRVQLGARLPQQAGGVPASG